MPTKKSLKQDFRKEIPNIIKIIDMFLPEHIPMLLEHRMEPSLREKHSEGKALKKKLTSLLDVFSEEKDIDDGVMREVGDFLKDEYLRPYLNAAGDTSKGSHPLIGIPDLVKRLTEQSESKVSEPKVSKTFQEIAPLLRSSVDRNIDNPGFRTHLSPLSEALTSFKNTPNDRTLQKVKDAYSKLPPRVISSLSSHLSPDQRENINDTFNDIDRSIASGEDLGRHIGKGSAQAAGHIPTNQDTSLLGLLKKAEDEFKKENASIKGTPEYMEGLKVFQDGIDEELGLRKGVPPKSESTSDVPSSKKKKNYLDPESYNTLEELAKGEERLKKEYPEGQLFFRPYMLKKYEEQRKKLTQAANPAHAAAVPPRSVRFDPTMTQDVRPSSKDDDWRSEASTEGGAALQNAIAEDTHDRDKSLREMEEMAAVRDLEGFDIGGLPEAQEEEHYTTTLQRWLDENIAKYAATQFNLPNTEIPDSNMLLEAEKRILGLMNKSEKLSPAEKLLVKHFKNIDTTRDDLTDADVMADNAAAPIDNNEVDQLMQPHIETMLDRLSARSNRSFNEARDRRLRRHEDEMLGRFHGGNWNSGARERFKREFNDDERIREREHLESLDDQAANMLFQGNIEGWARARGTRDALERGARHKEDTLRYKNQRHQDALEHNVMLDQSKQNSKLTSAGGAHQAALDRMNRDQSRLNQRAAVAQHMHESPLHRLAAAKRLISDGSNITPPASFPSPPVGPPQRSMFTNIGGILQGAMGAYGALQESSARSQLLNTRNQLAQQQLRQVPGQQPMMPGGTN